MCCHALVMKIYSAIQLLVLMVALFVGSEAKGQTVLLGKTPYDSVYPAFLNQQNNASNFVKGINLYLPINAVNVWNSALITNVLTDKSVAGNWYVTNAFILKRTNTVLTVDEQFNFKNSLGLAGAHIAFDEASASANDSNTVARLGVKQMLRNKLIDNFTLYSNNNALSGIVLAKGADFATAVAPKSGTNRFYIRTELGTATPSSYLEFKEGVLTAAQ